MQRQARRHRRAGQRLRQRRADRHAEPRAPDQLAEVAADQRRRRVDGRDRPVDALGQPGRADALSDHAKADVHRLEQHAPILWPAAIPEDLFLPATTRWRQARPRRPVDTLGVPTLARPSWPRSRSRSPARRPRRRRPAAATPAEQARVVELTNQARAANGLPPVSASAALDALGRGLLAGHGDRQLLQPHRAGRLDVGSRNEAGRLHRLDLDGREHRGRPAVAPTRSSRPG